MNFASRATIGCGLLCWSFVAHVDDDVRVLREIE